MKDNFSKSYGELLVTILSDGYTYPDPNRTGVRRKELFPVVLSYRFKDNSFPLLTSKPMFTRGIFIELMWMITGRTDVNYLIDRGVHVWDKDAYNFACRNGYCESFDKFIEEAEKGKEFSLGKIYGHQFRNCSGRDQLLEVINKLLDINYRYSTDLIISSWNVSDLNIIDTRTEDELYQDYLNEIK